MAGNVDAELFHNCYCLGPNGARLRSSACHPKAVSRIMAQQAFGHLRTGRIARAEYEHALLICHA
jgi:hypothetical protein